MAQKVKIEVYGDGGVVLSNIRNNLGVPVFSANDNISATLVNTWYDGSSMTDAKADGKVYFKLKSLPADMLPQYGQYVGKYFRLNLPYDKDLFLEKDTVADLRAMSSTEILLLKMEYYKGVKLNGYYTKEDTPAPIEYYLSTSEEVDNGGSIFSVGDMKLIHNFVGRVEVQYFGVIGVDSYSDINNVPDRSLELQSFEDYRRKSRLLGILNNLGHIRLNESIEVTDNINWINEAYLSGLDFNNTNKRIHVYASSLFKRVSGGTSTISGKLIGLTIEKKSLYSVNTPEGRLEFTSSRFWDNISPRSFEMAWNSVRHFGTTIFGGISNLTKIHNNRFQSIWFALISSYSNGTEYTMASTDVMTDSYIYNNYFNFEVQGEQTALLKGMRAGHITFSNNFSDFGESVIDNSVVSRAQYWTQCLFKDNIFDYFINFSKGGLYNCSIDDNFFMNMTVKAATIFNPPVNWGLYGSERVKTMEWGLFKDPTSFYGVSFNNNTVANLDFIVKTSSPLVVAGLSIKNNLWIKPDSDAGRNSYVLYSKKELRSKIKAPTINNTVLSLGQINDLGDMGYISDRISQASVMYDKISSFSDSYYQLGIFNSQFIDEIKGFSIIESTTSSKRFKASTSGKIVSMDSKPDLKVTGRKYAFELADALINNGFYEGDTVNCVELGSLTFNSGKLVDSLGVQRVLNSTELVAYNGSANVLAYVYDLGSFVQLFSAASKPWRGNNIVSVDQITSISSSMNLVGTTLPTQNLVPDRPFIQVDGSNNILGLYKVNSDYTVVPYVTTNKVRYEELLRDYGTTAQRPKYFVNNGFMYYNTDISKLQILKAGVWEDIVINATTTIKGIVNQTTPLTNISQADLLEVTTADGSDPATTQALANAIKAYINTNVVPLVNAIKASQNTELTNQRAAGQQST